MNRIPFVAGNWKMNTSKASAIELAKGVAKGEPDGVDVGVAPPFIYLDAVAQAIAGTPLLLGAQDVYFEKNGAFTGEISIEMLKDIGVKFCLAGHSERRHVIKESSELVAKKAAAIYNGGLILIHCVGEKLEQRDANQTLSVVKSQLDELTDSIQDPNRLVVAYEPVWAIGTGLTATPQQAQEAHAFTRATIAKRFNKNFANRIQIQYGGSVKASNAAELLSQPDVDGALVGGASLKIEEFAAILAAAAKQNP
jgi:triosephosphate isomerase (TIM)